MKNKDKLIKGTDGNRKDKLFDYQQNAISNLCFMDSKLSQFYSTLIVILTGGGKTRVAVQYAYDNVLNKEGGKVLWIAERLSLLDQAFDTFISQENSEKLGDRAGKKIRIAQISSRDAGWKELNQDIDLLIITQQTLKNVGKERLVYDKLQDWLKGADNLTVFIDEAHHAVSDPYQCILKSVKDLHRKEKFRKLHIIGLTATPKAAGKGRELYKTFFHGIEYKEKGKFKQATSNTSYAFHISINELVAKGILAKPYLAVVTDEKEEQKVQKVKNEDGEKEKEYEFENKLILSVYQKGLKGLKIWDGETGKETEEKQYMEFGQTAIFVSSRVQALLLEQEFRGKGIECGLAITIDNILKEKFREETGKELDKGIQGKERADCQKFKDGSLPVIISVDKFREGIDAPKTQTVFLANTKRNGAGDEVAVTQMAGRALRGVKQNGTPTAFIVSFGGEQLKNIMWEVPESHHLNKNNKESFSLPPEDGGILSGLKEKNLRVSPEEIEEQKNSFLTSLEPDEAESWEEDGGDSDRALWDYAFQSSGYIPYGYCHFNKKYLLVWDGMDVWIRYMREHIEELTEDVESIMDNSLQSYQEFKDRGKNIIYKNRILGEIYKREDFYSKEMLPRYFYYFVYLYWVIHSKNKGSFLRESEIIIFNFLNGYNLQEILWEGYGLEDGRIDEFLYGKWKKREELHNIWNNYNCFKGYFKPLIKKLNAIPVEEESDEAEEMEGDYFKVRLYREGRKRRNLCELLLGILKYAFKDGEKPEAFIDVFGGTGTVTAQMCSLFSNGKRLYNEYDPYVANFVYCVAKVKDFPEYCYERLKEMMDVQNQNNTDSSQKAELEILKELSVLESISKFLKDNKGNSNKEIKKKQDRLKNRSEYRKKQAMDDREYKTIDEKQKEKFEQNIYKNRYKELKSMEALLQKKDVKKVVKLYLSAYFLSDYEMREDKKFVEDWSNWMENGELVNHEKEIKRKAFQFLITRGFPSRQFSGASVAGVDTEGIKNFNKSLRCPGSWLSEFHEKIKDINISSKDFMDVLKKCEPKAVYYLDPPYFLTKQYNVGFPDSYHLKMLEWLRTTDCKWILSCKDSVTNKNSRIDIGKRIDKKGLIQWKNSKGESSLAEYFKLFLYQEELEEKYSYKGEEYAMFRAGTEKGKCQRNVLFVYRLKDEKKNEIMISNIQILAENEDRFERHGFEIQKFEDFLENLIKDEQQAEKSSG